MTFYDKLFQSGIIAVIRANSQEEGYHIAKACLLGGIKILEITFTVPEADQLIKRLHQDPLFKDAIIGAGSVIDIATAEKAALVQSDFIVGPNVDEEIASLCSKLFIPYMPGCMTINEMIHAMKHGAKVIKLFPGQLFGPGYIKALKAPLPELNIMPTGGVSLDNMNDWFKAGVFAVGIGSELTGSLPKKDYAEIERKARLFTSLFHDIRSKEMI